MINFLYSKFRKKEVLDYRKRYMNVGLQGSCLIFSKDFIDNENKAFDPEPFLYEEEVFLFLRCKKRNYKMLYDPSIGIILCKDMNKVFVDFVIKDYTKPMGVATYETSKDMLEELKKVLPVLMI